MTDLYQECAKVVAELEPVLHVIKWSQTGSSYICDPPVLNTDIDILTLSREGDLSEHGWERCSGEEYEMGSEDFSFQAWRKGKYNLIVTSNREYYYSFLLATKLAKKLNLKEKEQRITLFNYIIREDLGNDEDEEENAIREDPLALFNAGADLVSVPDDNTLDTTSYTNMWRVHDNRISNITNGFRQLNLFSTF